MTRPLHEIADEIRRDWSPVYYGARPYLDAMRYLDTMAQSYGHDSARDIVVRFLTNARTWKGDTARRIKTELKEMSK